jgi:uncharacterized protein (DUF2267 family)
MSANGLDVFDRTLQTTHIWLDEIMEELGPSRQIAWHVLGTVLRAIRCRIPIELSAHLGAQLPLLVRGAYYDQFRPSEEPDRWRTMDDFVEVVAEGLAGLRPVNPRDAILTVFRVLSRHIDAGQVEKIKQTLPEPIRKAWQSAVAQIEGPSNAARGREPALAWAGGD